MFNNMLWCVNYHVLVYELTCKWTSPGASTSFSVLYYDMYFPLFLHPHHPVLFPHHSTSHSDAPLWKGWSEGLLRAPACCRAPCPLGQAGVDVEQGMGVPLSRSSQQKRKTTLCSHMTVDVWKRHACLYRMQRQCPPLSLPNAHTNTDPTEYCRPVWSLDDRVNNDASAVVFWLEGFLARFFSPNKAAESKGWYFCVK